MNNKLTTSEKINYQENLNLDNYQATIKKLAANEPTKRNKFRQDSLNQLTSVGLPNRKNDLWKYTSIHTKKILEFNPCNSDNIGKLLTFTEALAQIKPYINNVDDYQLILFNNGYYLGNNFATDSESEFDFINLAKYQQNRSSSHEFNINQDIEKYYDSEAISTNSQTNNTQNKAFNLLNNAATTDGCFISIKPSKTINKTFAVVYLNNTTKNNVAISPQNHILVNENSSAELLEIYISNNNINNCFTNAVTTINLKSNAKLTHTVIQHATDNNLQLTDIEVSQQKNSFLTTSLFSFGGEISRINYHAQLLGNYANTNINALKFTKNKQV
ncbi:MAG: SufD family Fe-S cluster assembly protein, partial [Romboutsia sp.]|nr:SufD family Fe-S cluster assembly protein [Romboutsia sp.]